MHSLRRPRVEDAAAMYELISAYETAVIGAPDMTPEDVADELVEPGFDRDKDGWLAQDADGRLLASAWACSNGDSDLVDVDVIIRPDVEGLAEELWPAVLGRARELAAERGHGGATVHLGVHRADHAKRAMARELGFEPGTSFHRMRIDHDGPVEPPAPPPGLTLSSGADDAVRREAHRVQQEAFAEHFGFVKLDYDLWYERRQAQTANDWNQLALARIDGWAAGVVIGSDQFVPDQDCGYVATLAVLPEFRRQGLGRFLLRHAFAADASRGRRGTILHVDSNNTTPAPGLYESAGMRPVMAIDVWHRRL
ncbi:GNAT family N-acetyltransferase [Nonomuraea sp. KC401]|uniref:GNAT family N-acetyltransferase n=1 Tax=Nonomuraea sp. KC401 TaxID=1848324 RepID=UPI0010FDC674|nr:N-acetyltransferase [Nonomuraea sp. KC401]NBE97655.1 GNAT family N-acetyltransferase [Nonomuraea sp. K271]TLF71389.1 GNAT family N-acetyltransferase [Nonomuraea sp. KC401]